jgi:hypothetical protein
MLRSPIVILAFFVSRSLFAAGHDLSTSPPAGHQILPVVTGNGSGFMAAWTELASPFHYIVASQAVSANGEPIASGGTSSDQPPVYSIAIGHGRSDTLLTWILTGSVVAERLSPSGMPVNTTLITSGPGYQSDVAVAWNGSRYFAIWTTNAQLLGAFVDADGSSTAPRAFFSDPALTGQGPEEIAVAPAVAWDGQHFIAVFAELPNRICLFECPAPDPDRFRVMRVSANGEAIDPSPLVISGTHLRAHVASSGAESLIALDSRSEVSTIVVHNDQRGLTLDAETPLVRWFSDIWSDVAWDGATYTAVWRYAAGDASWIGAAHVTRSGLPFDYRFAATGTLRSSWWGRPSIAVNDSGVTAFAVSEGTGPSSIDRARLYLASELAPMPPPPPAPKNVVSYFGGTTARIDWQSDFAAAGFVIEWSWDSGKDWSFVKTVPGDARTTTVYASAGNQFRVRAFGPGGESVGTITSIGSMFRRRGTRP